MSLLKRRNRPLGIESLESRTLMAADPLPVLLVLADQQDFYFREYGDTRASLEAAGVGVVVAATTTNPTTAHPNTGQGAGSGVVTPDVALAQVEAADYSAIVFVGGWGASMYQYAYNDPNFDGVADNYYANPAYNGDPTAKAVVNGLINDFVAQDKHVAGVCHGVSVLAWARVDGQSPLAGRRVSVPLTVGNPSQFYAGDWYADMELLGQHRQVVDNGGLANSASGQYGDPTTAADDVVVDGRIITAENYDSAARFGEVIAEQVLAAVPPPPPVEVVGKDLMIRGTDQADTIRAWSAGAARRVVARVNGQTFGPFVLPAGGWVVVHGGAGDDQVFAGGLRLGATVLGGDGDDRLGGGAGRDVLLGGDGDDFLHGREGNDVLIGGDGNDQVHGGAGDDLLIGGTTVHDGNPAALHAVPPAVLARRLKWGASVTDDGAGDVLVGGPGADWYFAGLADAVRGKQLGDKVVLP